MQVNKFWSKIYPIKHEVQYPLIKLTVLQDESVSVHIPLLLNIEPFEQLKHTSFFHSAQLISLTS